MQTSTIKFSQIEDRIDAKYYKPEYLELEKILSRGPKTKTLREISTKIVDGPFGSDLLKSEYTEEGVPLLRVQNVSGEGIDVNNFVFITKEKQKELKRSKVLAGDLVITKAGRVGTVDIVPSSISEANITSHLAKISLKKEYNPYFVYVYLNSRLGLLQIERQGIKSTKPELNIDEVAITKLIIPSQSFQQKIENMVKEAQEKRRFADGKYKDAKEILNKELGLKDLDLSTQKTFEAKFSETTERIDPEYYQPKYYKFWKIVKKRVDLKRLQDIITKIDYGTVPTSPYVLKEQGIPYIKGKDVKPNHMALDDLDYLHKGTEHLIGNKIVKENDILITQMGTVGDAAVIPKKAKDFAFGSFILRIRLKDFSKTDPYYIATIINSLIGKLQIFREMRIATVRANTDIPTIKNLKIPILSKSLQQKISSLIQESFKLRQEAKELIERAKKAVEEIVEGN